MLKNKTIRKITGLLLALVLIAGQFGICTNLVKM